MAQGSSNPTTINNVTKIAGTAVDTNTGNASAGTQRVVLATNQPAVAVTGTFYQGTQPVSIATLPALAAGSAAIGTVEIGATSLAALETISAAQSGTWTVQPGNTANTTAWLVKPAESLGTATALNALNAEIIQALNGNLGIGSTITAISAPTGITLTPYVSYDGGTNWTVTQFFNVTSALALATITTFVAGDSYAISAGDGATHVKVRATAWTSGSVTVRLSASNSQGLVNLKSTAVHDDVAGTYTQLVSGYASSTAPTAVTAGDSSRIWTTLNGAVNIADGGSTISIDDGGSTITVDGTVTLGAGTAAIGKLTANTGVTIGAVEIAATQTLATVTTVGAVTSITNALPAGTNAIGKLAANSGVDIGDVDVTSVTPGTGATNLGKAVDSVGGASDVGVAALVLRDDALTAISPADGDYTRLRVGSTGRLWASATIDAALPAGTNAIGSITNTSFAVTNATPSSLQVSATQVAGTAATRWYTQISDGTTSPAIKAASTAAATADPAMVVSFAAANSATKISDGTTTATVKTAITEPAFGTDTALVVQTRDPVRIRPSETYRDPVDKMRVSMGQSLIDTDFEYGIQPTKWESLTLLNNRATAFYDVTQVAPGTINSTAVTISAITASAKTVTVTGTNLNTAGVFAVGQPIFITGTLDTANVDGWWIVDTVAATTLTFLVNTAPAASLYDATKTYIYPGTFFTGSNISLATSAAIAATIAVADTVGNFTCGASTLAIGNPVYVTGTNTGTGSISGYASGNVYYIIATNGTTTFQLSATPGGTGVTTVAGTLVGLTFSMNAVTVTGTTVVVRTLRDHGLRVGNGVYMTGTTGVTGGPVNGTWNIATTPLNNVFTYTTNASATGAITSTPTTTLYPRQPGYIEHRPYDGGVQFSNETAYHGYTDIRQTRRYFRYQSGKGIQFSTGTIMKPPFYVDSLTASGTTVTVTTKYPHGLLVGSTVVVTGATPAAYNGTFTVTGSTPLTITYTAGSAPGTSPATGFPINVSPGTWYGGANRVGMFDQQNGFFFEFDGQTLYAVIRKSTDQISGKVAVTLGSQTVTGTGSYFSSQLKPGDQVVIRGMAYIVQNIQSDTSMTVYPEYRGVTTSNCICTKTVETKTAQSAWNIDTVSSGTRSATNPNGFALDLTKMQMFYADYSWYGAGAVRFGFKDQRGEVIFCHRVVNSNVNYEAYMRSGNLPARYETNTLPVRTHLTATLAAATTTGGTITVDSTTLFPSSGTVILSQATATGAYSEYITYSAKTATTFTITARAQAGGVGTAQTFTYSATAPIKVEMYAPQAAQTLSHWGSSVIMDGGYDDDKSLVFNTGMTTPMITAAAGTRYPLMSLRLAPTVDNGITGLLGAREIINRMQLALRSIGTYTTTVAFRIEILLNARVSGGTFAPVGGSSLSQICYHTNAQTVTGGESMFAFYATANDTNSMDLAQVRDLGTSILGGGTTLTFPSGNAEKYPDGPDIITVIAIPLTANAASSIVARLNWTEAQA